MGARGPLPKPSSMQQGHRTTQRPDNALVLTQPDEVTIPEPPSDLLPPTIKAWETFWSSDVASILSAVDHPAVYRLFLFYDQWERSMKVARRALAVKGSAGQIRVNPLADHAIKLDATILRLENELGLTPLSRARLGLTVGQAELTIAELNRMAERTDTHDADLDALDAEWS